MRMTSAEFSFRKIVQDTHVMRVGLQLFYVLNRQLSRGTAPYH
jgi:hypothetical protein